MPKHALKKFVRDKTASGRLQIQPHDLPILRDIAEYRFMDTGQIAALHHRGLRNIQRRLALFFHAGYLERPRQQKKQNIITGSLVYGLGNEGVAVLYEGGEKNKRFWQVRNDRNATYPHIAHTLLISKFRALVTLALEDGSHGTLARWEDAHALKKLLAPRGGRAELVPDGFFTIQTPKGKLNFFFEADLASESKVVWLAKMKTYWKWFHARTMENALGISKFQVLTVANGAKRTEALRMVTKEADPKHEGSLLFMFADEEAFSLTRPESVLAPVWLSPKDDAKRLLIP